MECEQNGEGVAAVERLFTSWVERGKDEQAAAEHSYAAYRVLDSLDWKSTDHYLDIGCGNGYTLRYVEPRIPLGIAAGIDLSPAMIVKARKLASTIIPTIFFNTDFMMWNEPGVKFDKIFSMEAFYYFFNVPAAIRKAAQLLQPGGTFSCVVDFYAENEASREWPCPHQCGVPMQRYSKTEYITMFREAGLTNIEQEQIRYPKELTDEAWKREIGSLVTIGHKLRA